MPTLFLREIKRNRKQFLVWTISIVAASLLMMAFYPTFADQAASYNELMKKMPKGLTSALGINRLDFSKLLDYFSYVFPYFLLFGGMYAMIMGSGAISKEEDEKTAEFLLAKPITRSSVVTGKVLCVLFYLVMFNALNTVANYIMFEAIKGKTTYNLKAFMILMAGFFLFQAFFAALGLIISVFIVRNRTLNPLSIGVVLAMFFFSIAAEVTDKLADLKYLTPFKYFNAIDLVKNEGIKTLYLVITAVFVTISVAAVYFLYSRKNITA